MYKCQKCNKLSKSGESINRFVVSTREKEYINKTFDKKGREYCNITHGSEIVKEIIVCQECYSKLNLQNNKQEKVKDNNIYNQQYKKQYDKRYDQQERKQYNNYQNDKRTNNYNQNQQYNKNRG